MASTSPAEESAAVLPRRSITRARLLSAAKQVFATGGYDGATMDEIAQAAGTRRSTLYLHFRDKEDFLGAIAQEQIRELRAIMGLLGGPAPTRQKVAEWVAAMTEVSQRERVPSELLSMAQRAPVALRAVDEFNKAFQEVMAEQVPAFRDAFARGGQPRAWALAVLDVLGWALSYGRRAEGDPQVADRMAVATDLITGFIDGTLPPR